MIDDLLKNKLLDKYPWIFDNCIDHLIPETWHEIVISLTERIREIYEFHGIPFYKNNFGFSQIKEKFGLLRIYLHIEENIEKSIIKLVYEEVHKAELESSKICVACGSKEDLIYPKKYFYDILCKDCNSKKGEK